MATKRNLASRREELEAQIEARHDWRKGQTRSGGGTEYHRTDECQICGMQRHYQSDYQNGVEDHFSYTLGNGDTVTLRDAAQMEC